MSPHTRPGFNIDKERVIVFLPPVAIFIVVYLLVAFIIMPSIAKLQRISSQIENKSTVLTYVERSGDDLNRLRAEIQALRTKIEEYEKKMPQTEQTVVLIAALKDITTQSRLRFSSIEPQPIEQISLGDANDVYLQLPIRVKLECDYYDLLEFLSRLETAGRLMKIADIRIRSIPDRVWEHDINLLITTFAKRAKNPPSTQK